MWILFLVLLTPLPGLDKRYELSRHQTMEECLLKMQVVKEGMEAAYPGDVSYSLICHNSQQV